MQHLYFAWLFLYSNNPKTTTNFSIRYMLLSLVTSCINKLDQVIDIMAALLLLSEDQILDHVVH